MITPESACFIDNTSTYDLIASPHLVLHCLMPTPFTYPPQRPTQPHIPQPLSSTQPQTPHPTPSPHPTVRPQKCVTAVALVFTERRGAHTPEWRGGKDGVLRFLEDGISSTYIA